MILQILAGMALPSSLFLHKAVKYINLFWLKNGENNNNIPPPHKPGCS